MNLGQKAVKFREIAEEDGRYEKNPETNHTFRIAPGYLLDVEITSFISDEGRANHNVAFRVSGPNEITVHKGVRHCGC